MSWSDERVEILKKLWVDGLSASQIAKQLGGVTRNAVIGKVHRLGLAGRAAPSRPIKRVVRPRPTLVTENPEIEIKAAIPEQKIKQPEMPQLHNHKHEVAPRHDGVLIGVLDLGPNMCKWPIGDPTDAEFGFCGAKSHASWPYCKEHGEIAYQPQLKKGMGGAKVEEERKAV